MNNSRTKTKNILITQPKLESFKSQYAQLEQKYQVNIDFESLVHVEEIPAKIFRQERKNLADYSAIIFTSRIAIDQYFRLSEEMKHEASPETKYFCATEFIALYLQKYINYKKRKVFFPKKGSTCLKSILTKYKAEKFLFPCSEFHKENTIVDIRKAGFDVDEAVIYRIVCSEAASLRDRDYDIIAFFSPHGIKSLLKNKPNFKQNHTKIAAFGASTHEAVVDAGLNLDIKVPTLRTPSMSMAIEEYLKKRK